MIKLLLLLFISNANAADEMKSGTVLKEDSYVFSIEEAEKLKSKIEDLEKKEKILEQYKILDNLREQQTNLLQSSLTMRDDQVKLYKEILKEKDKEISLLKDGNNKKILNITAAFCIGMVFTGTSIYIADKFDDSMEK